MGFVRYHQVQLDEIPEVECCCGTTRRAFVDIEEAPASAHLVKIKEEPTSHYHKKTTEIYLVISGKGHLELDGQLVPVRPLSAFLIQPGCRHRAIGEMQIVNIPIPKHDENDFYYDEVASSLDHPPRH